MEELPKVGIFGSGPLVNVLMPHIRKAGFQVIAIWSENQEDADEAAHRLDIGFSTCNMDDVLLHKEIGLLMVLCSPVNHAQIAVKALGIAKHVYVHPPCSISSSQVLRMVQSAAYYPNLMAVVGMGLRSLPAVEIMKRQLEQNYVGKSIVHCDVRLNSPCLIGQGQYSWKCSETMGGGVLNQYGTQIIDLVTHLTGQKAARIHCVLRTVRKTTPVIRGIRGITADDVTVLSYETNTNCLVTVSLNGQSSSFAQELTITGEEGQLVLRNASLYGRKFGLDNNVNSASEELMHLDTKSGGNHELPDVYVAAYGQLFMHLKDRFLAVSSSLENNEAIPTNVTNNATPNVDLGTFEEALHTTLIIEAARQSSLEKGWVRL